MILGSARTGSTLLMSLLSAHEDIKMYGELFNLDKLPKPALVEVLEDPVGYLQRRINGTQPANIRAVGFKIFYDHLTREYFEKIMDPEQAVDKLKERLKNFESFLHTNYAWDDLAVKFGKTWDYLVEDTGIKVIHLKRRNKLETMVSLKTAFLTDEWMRWNSKPPTITTVSLSPEECSRYFKKLEAYEQKYAALFSRHPVHEVTYEDLVEKKDEVMAGIFNFLELPRKPVSTIMKKQNVFSLQQTVSNYHELKEQFSTSHWQAFFR